MATPDPLFTNWPDFPLINNAESLIDTTDMVFLDPPGTGLSEAIRPSTNKSFWSVDADVQVIRDFVRRYLAVNNRGNSPLYLFGESYGAPRTNMLALALEAAGVPVTGIVLQSSILSYFSDPGMTYAIAAHDQPQYNHMALMYTNNAMIGYFLSYGQVATYFNQVAPPPPSMPAYAQYLQDFSTANYDTLKPYSPSFFFSETPLVPVPQHPDTATLSNWSRLTRMSTQALNAFFGNAYYATTLIPGSTIGRYDGRVVLHSDDPLMEGNPYNDPSDILIAQPFADNLAVQMPSYLGYTAPNATYMPLNEEIIYGWDFSHAGLPLPDSIPDLLAVLMLNPSLKILSINGYHDMATPFFLTENQLARLKTITGLNPSLYVTFYRGGHMTYLDDVARPRMKADLSAYYKGEAISDALTLATLPPPWPNQSPPDMPGSQSVTRQIAPARESDTE